MFQGIRGELPAKQSIVLQLEDESKVLRHIECEKKIDIIKQNYAGLIKAGQQTLAS